MSHIQGHWEDDGLTSVGANRPKKKFCVIGLGGSERFPLLGVNNFGYQRDRHEDDLVGFHLHLFPTEIPDEYYGIAFDIVGWEDHIDAEAYFNSQIGGPKKKLEDFGDSDFETFNELPDDDANLDSIVFSRLNQITDSELRSKKHDRYINNKKDKLFRIKQVIQQTKKYMNSKSYNLIKKKSTSQLVGILVETDLHVRKVFDEIK